ncbi:MAG: c-type cytochrome [Bacteroidota bacterium]
MKNIRSIVIACGVILLMNACDSSQDIKERPWVMRSVLDGKPRMISVMLDSQMYLAYDLAKCQLYKVWKGGIDIQGAPYTDVKNIQPTSWGVTYTKDDVDPFRWLVLNHGEPVETPVRNTGYLYDKNGINFGYRIILGQDTVIISENPSYSEKDNKPSLVRNFNTGNIPAGYKILLVSSSDTIQMTPNEFSSWQQSFDYIPQPEKPVLEPAFDHRGRLFIEKSDCGTCHEVDHKMVGPSYIQIAQRYAGQDVRNLLVERIKNGSKGEWGEAMMTPHPTMSNGELRTAVDYILSLAKEPRPETGNQPAIQSEEAAEKEIPKPGFGAPLEGLHPSYKVTVLHNSNFKPRVAAMAFMPDGRLLVSTWDKVGGVYLLDGVQGDSSTLKVKLIASGLHEPLGMEVVDGEIFVLQKHELTQLIDHDGDEIIDEYKAICNTWGVSNDFHEFAFGLVYKENHFYVTLSMAMRLLETEEQKVDRGRTIKIARDGTYEWVNYGMRTPNGIGLGPDDEIFIADNQGRWTPANKIIHLQKGAYMGMRWGILEGMELPEETPPAIWLEEDEIGNSPSEIVLIHEGPYKGQLLHGEVTHGGIKRDFLEKVNGQYQGAVFRFTQGLTAGINRMRWGPDGHLYAGGVGMVGGWSWKGRQYSLERMEYTGKPAFEMLAVRAKQDGFELEMTLPLESALTPDDIKVQQWRYVPTANYGGPKVELEDLTIQSISYSDDMRKIQLIIPGLKPGHVVYFLLPDTLKSASGLPLWSGETWYTLNQIPTLN